jgi:hypothetical protein
MLIVPVVFGQYRQELRGVSGAQQDKKIRSVDRNPAQEMSPCSEGTGVIISEVIMQFSAVNQYRMIRASAVVKRVHPFQLLLIDMIFKQ